MLDHNTQSQISSEHTDSESAIRVIKRKIDERVSYLLCMGRLTVGGILSQASILFSVSVRGSTEYLATSFVICGRYPRHALGCRTTGSSP